MDCLNGVVRCSSGRVGCSRAAICHFRGLTGCVGVAVACASIVVGVFSVVVRVIDRRRAPGIYDLSVRASEAGRESHSILGSLFLNPTIAAGVAFGSGGTQMRKGRFLSGCCNVELNAVE